ncbi:MAG: surface-adhesin E family protein [Nitrospiraceae bacterium]
MVFERDYKIIQRGPSASYLSYKVQSEYDCSEERIRRFSATFFSGSMGSGDVVHVLSNEGKWQPVEPGNRGQSEWKLLRLPK